MNKECNKRSKKGSYLVEAALTMPIFILAVLMLLSGIPVLSTSENVVFTIIDEMRIDTVKAAFRQNSYVLPLMIQDRVVTENRRITEIPEIHSQYLYTKNQIQDLISVRYQFQCEGNDPLGLFHHAEFKGKITARAFTGKVHQHIPSDQSQEDRIVYIFPEWGMRYHDADCTYIRGSCRLVYLSGETKKDYDPCKLCNAGSAPIGSPVFCFSQYGEVYHLDTCRQVSRYYIQTGITIAIEQGYAPCTKCGGQ